MYERSIHGYARAISPLLDEPLKGPVHLTFRVVVGLGSAAAALTPPPRTPERRGARLRAATPVFALCALAVALPLGGCGGGGEESAPTPSSATTSPSQEASVGQGAGGGRTMGGADSQGEAARGGEQSIEEFGSEAAGSDKQAILAAEQGYLTALAGGDLQRACSYLAATVHRSLEQLVVKRLKDKGCAAILPKLLAPTAPAIAREQAEGRITKVRVEGDRAFVVFHAPGAKLYQLTMVREGGEWKPTTVAASVLVPDLGP